MIQMNIMTVSREHDKDKLVHTRRIPALELWSGIDFTIGTRIGLVSLFTFSLYVEYR